MQQADRVDWSIHFVANEFEPFQANGLGPGNISIANHDTLLDVGCGGGRTVNKLAAIAKQGKVYGVDYSEESIAFTTRTNAQWIEAGRVEIRRASVSQLPFPDNTFNVITARGNTLLLA